MPPWGITGPHLDTALDEIPAYPNTDPGCAGPPFTPTLKKTLAQSLREASLLGHDTIGTGTRILTHLTTISPHEMRDRLQELAEHPQPHE